MLTLNSLRIPRNWEIIAGADTGTYMGGAICAIDPNYELYVLEEFPNYRYTGSGTIELIGMTVGEWIQAFATSLKRWTKDAKVAAWVDANTTFKTEVAHGLRFKMNRKDLELRTEILREYVRGGRIHLMPWLEIIPYEMEEAQFPAAESVSSGRLRRLKKKDHCLDGVEHVASRRPHPDFDQSQNRIKGGFEQLRESYRGVPVAKEIDSHLGQN